MKKTISAVTLALVMMAQGAMVSASRLEPYMKVEGGFLHTGDDVAEAFDVGVGIRVNKYISLEAGHVEYGKYQKNESLYRSEVLQHRKTTTRISGEYIGVVGTSPIKEGLYMQLYTGVLFSKTKMERKAINVDSSGNNQRLFEYHYKNTDRGFIGVGVVLKRTQKINTTLKFIAQDAIGEDIYSVRLGAEYNF